MYFIENPYEAILIFEPIHVTIQKLDGKVKRRERRKKQK